MLTSCARACEIGSLGRVVFLPEDTARVLGAKIPEQSENSGLTLSEDFLYRMKAKGCGVLYQSDAFADGTAFTMQELYKRRKNKDALDGKLLYSADKPDCWYFQDPLFNKQTPRSGWRIAGRDVIPGTPEKNCVLQSLIVAGFVEELFGNELSKDGKDAITELRGSATSLEKQCAGPDWQNGAKKWAKLKFAELFLPYSVEVLFQILLDQEINRERLFASRYGRTSRLSSGGFVVGVGGAGADGAYLSGWGPGDRYGDLGCFLSCSAELWAPS